MVGSDYKEKKQLHSEAIAQFCCCSPLSGSANTCIVFVYLLSFFLLGRVQKCVHNRTCGACLVTPGAALVTSARY